MARGNPNHTPWTQEEADLLLLMRLEDNSWATISQAIGRSEVACRSKLNHMTHDPNPKAMKRAASDWLWQGIKDGLC